MMQNAATIGEMIYGAARGMKDFIVALGTGGLVAGESKYGSLVYEMMGFLI